MSGEPTAESLCERLKQAQEHTEVLLKIDDAPNIVEMDKTRPPRSSWEARRSIDRFLDEGTWRAGGPGFQRLREWVEVHWNPGRETEAPTGTVATRNGGGQVDTQLDAATAVKKLIAAAKLYGTDEVARYAVEFATHGMIEVHSTYLLKGPPVEAAMCLDDYCTLLQYGEASGRPDAGSDRDDWRIAWPEPDAGNVCALEARYFERPENHTGEHLRYMSPLLKDGPDYLALLLGLVWGCGLRVFGSWHHVPAPAAAALPYRHMTWKRGAGNQLVTLVVAGYGPAPWKRPLPAEELRGLVSKFSGLSEHRQRRLRRAMERVRKSTERVDDEDRIVDLGIALETLFMDGDEQLDPATLVPPRAAWHYADSADERRQTEDMLEVFFSRHSTIVHGRGPGELRANDQPQTARMLSGADDVLRASVKSMIAEGWQRDWPKASDPSSFRADPPRTESETPSAKSDSLSWSVEELSEIDRELKAAWQRVVNEAPRPPSHVGATTVAGIAPALLEGYREQGIPYVVIHPARLYMAHPKWPKAESEPLGERAEYYCARDVTRHMRLWSEASARKGLVQVEVPFDDELYHPRNRDRWPEPLLSSHEEPLGVGTASERPAPGQMASLGGSTPLANTENGEDAVAEEEPASPPPDWPDTTLTGLNEEWGRLWQAFRHDVNVATNSLLHLLDAIHGKHLAERQRLVLAIQASSGRLKTLEDAVRAVGGEFLPTYPKLRAFPTLSGEPLFLRAAPDGPMEQIALSGWLTAVWDLWENRYRNQLKHEFRHLPGAIRPRQQVLGDLRHIRNNLLHGGIARPGQAAGCEILRWFTDGEPTQVRLKHVFDFLNQMGWLNEGSFVLLRDRGATSGWYIDRTREPEVPPPGLISVRPLVHAEEQDPRFRYEGSIVFANGVFGRTPMGPEKEGSEAQAKRRTQKWMKMTVNDAGDLHVPGVGTVSAAKLYRSYLEGEKHPGPGLREPWVQFRE